MLQGGIVEKGSHECRMEFGIKELETAIISPFSAYQPDMLAERPLGPFGNKVRRHADRLTSLIRKVSPDGTVDTILLPHVSHRHLKPRIESREYRQASGARTPRIPNLAELFALG
jgi:hypothetical protein